MLIVKNFLCSYTRFLVLWSFNKYMKDINLEEESEFIQYLDAVDVSLTL